MMKDGESFQAGLDAAELTRNDHGTVEEQARHNPGHMMSISCCWPWCWDPNPAHHEHQLLLALLAPSCYWFAVGGVAAQAVSAAAAAGAFAEALALRGSVLLSNVRTPCPLRVPGQSRNSSRLSPPLVAWCSDVACVLPA